MLSAVKTRTSSPETEAADIVYRWTVAKAEVDKCARSLAEARRREEECWKAVFMIRGGERPLTPRTREVLALVVLGKCNKEIASHLNISLRTAKFHVSELLARSGVRSRHELHAHLPLFHGA